MAGTSVQSYAAAHARAVRSKNPEEAARTKRDLTAAKLERAIEEAVATAPPLTQAQRDRLAALLTGTSR